MSPAKKRGSPVVFRGAPRRLAALLPAARGERGRVAVELAIPEAPGAGGELRQAAAALPASFSASLRRSGALRLHLPRNTPPGRYEGVLRFEDGEQPVTVEVEPRVRLRLFPKSLQTTAAPRESVAAELHLFNDGNTPATVREAYAFWLFHQEVADRILDRILHAEAQTQLREGRLGPVVDALNDQFGGRVRARIDSGAGDIAPGEARQLSVTFVLPERLRAGQVYEGMWHLHNVRWRLRVTVSGGTQRKETEP